MGRYQERMTLCSTSCWWWICFWMTLGMECLYLKIKGMERSQMQMESRVKMSKNLIRNGSSDTASIKGLFCFYILQTSSKFHITLLLLLQFPKAAEYISAQSTKQLNKVIYGILWSLYMEFLTIQAVSLWIMERVRWNLCFHANWCSAFCKTWNLKIDY